MAYGFEPSLEDPDELSATLKATVSCVPRKMWAAPTAAPTGTVLVNVAPVQGRATMTRPAIATAVIAAATSERDRLNGRRRAAPPRIGVISSWLLRPSRSALRCGGWPAVRRGTSRQAG